MKKQIPFDLERALAGAQVQYRNGRNLTRDDWHWYKNSKEEYCFKTEFNSYNIKGKVFKSENCERDLMLLVNVEKVERWINVYPNEGYYSKKDAIENASSTCIGQAFISIEV